MVFNTKDCIGRSCRLLANSERKISLTNSSRGIHNAWHFYCALVLVFKAVCSGFGVALFTP
ncbi:DUF3265 domain-containing protein [Vibrio parahaemolyticus]|nr:DUF3265 domain-containing protein [Vibrio parahaemolyticus]MDG2565635.1 DUF3265 domain-containing protein [Vibrio parahaemolyticus]MDG2614497.1 DUF3265 domain-containing protein [Vibrio parahaemolyticus]